MRQLSLLAATLLVVCSGFLGASLHAQSASQVRVKQPAATSTLEKNAEIAPGGAGHGTLAFNLSYYDNDDSGDGNPFLDEDLEVIEQITYLSYNVTDTTTIWGKLQYDFVSSASIDRLSKFPQQSGASGDNYFGLDLGVRHQLSESRRFGAFVSVSTEYDYNSIGIGGDYAFDLNNKNTTLKIGANLYYDTLDVIRFNGVEESSDERFSISSTVTWYQAMTPLMHAELGLTTSYQAGFLETPYNAVVIENPADPPNPNLANQARGTEITEELPSNRVRSALFGRIRRDVGPSTALELGGRLYADTWGIFSFAIEPVVYQWLVEDTLKLRVRYRYYTQTEADDFQDSFTTISRFRTQDSDLADFDSHTVGIRLDWYRTATTSFSFGIDYVKRSDDLDQFLASIGMTTKF